MIRSTHLRIGNIVTLCYENFEPDTVTVLEPGLVHLSRRSNADNEKDVTGIAVSAEVLLQHDFTENGNIYTRNINGWLVEIEILSGTKTRWIKIGTLAFHISYLHQIQNLIFYITGQEFPLFITCDQD